MNFFTIGKFVFALFILQTLGGLFNYYFWGAKEPSSAELEIIKQCTIHIIVSIPVYMYFAYKVNDKNYSYAFLAAFIVLVLGVLITTFMTYEVPSIALLAIDITALVFACVLGTYIGLKLRTNHKKKK